MKMTEDTEISSPQQTVTPEQELNRISYFRALNRRRFLTGLGSAGIAAGAAAVLGCGSSSNTKGMTGGTTPPVMAGSPQPNDVLNFALNLEYLEASFYLYATTGTGLSSTDMGSGAGTVTGGAQVTFTTPAIADIAAQIAADELAHVELLRSALGSAAVPMPDINLNALGIGFASQAQFLLLARAFEDTGVSAYLGGAGYLASSTSTLQTAAQILAVEAYHAGNIRSNIIQLGLASMDKATDSMDVPTSALDSADNKNSYFCDTKALAIVRTPQQVLDIVYANSGGAAGVTSGGFYPKGMNGTIVST